MAKRRRAPRRNRHYRIDHELKPEDLKAYRSLLREPRTTNKSAHAWLVERGYTTFSESAVARHKRHQLELFAEDAQALERARQWATVARDTKRDGGDVVEGAVTLTEALVCRALFEIDSNAPVSDYDLDFFGRVLSRLVGTRVQLAKFRIAARARGAAHDVSASGMNAPPTEEEQRKGAPLTEEEQDEAKYKKVCELLRQPYHPPEQRAALKRKWEDFERRRAEGLEAPGNN